MLLIWQLRVMKPWWYITSCTIEDMHPTWRLLRGMQGTKRSQALLRMLQDAKINGQAYPLSAIGEPAYLCPTIQDRLLPWASSLA